MACFLCPKAKGTAFTSTFHQIIGVSSQTRSRAASKWFSHAARAARLDVIPPSLLQCLSRPRLLNTIEPRQDFQTKRLFFSKIIRYYEDLPKDYEDHLGISFRNKDLSAEEIGKIFSGKIESIPANRLLRILHGRRVAGTLDDPSFAVHTSRYKAKHVSEALDYLRKTVPVEEVHNAGLRAEDELNEMDGAAADSVVKSGKAFDAEKKKKKSAEEEYKPDPVYGRSQFDEIRHLNRKENAKRQEELEAQRKEREIQEGVASGPLSVRMDEKRLPRNPKVLAHYKAAQSDIEAPPEMKAYERILPSAVVVLLGISFMAALASVYMEPSTRYRLFPEVSPAWATVGSILAVNTLILCLWRVPPLWKYFNRWMILSIGIPKPFSLFGSIFSHQALRHLAVNMLPLLTVGPLLHEDIGRANFLMLFIGCGSLGFLGSLATYTYRGWLGVTTLGASGGMFGVCSAYFWEHRKDGFKLFGLPDNGVHGIVFWSLLVALQLATIGSTAKQKLDVASHLVGTICGVVGIELIQRSQAKRANEQKDKQVFELTYSSDGFSMRERAPRAQVGGGGVSKGTS